MSNEAYMKSIDYRLMTLSKEVSAMSTALIVIATIEETQNKVVTDILAIKTRVDKIENTIRPIWVVKRIVKYLLVIIVTTATTAYVTNEVNSKYGVFKNGGRNIYNQSEAVEIRKAVVPEGK